MDFVSGAFLRRPAITHRHIPGTDARFSALVNKLRARGTVNAKEREKSGKKERKGGRKRGGKKGREANRKLVLECTSGSNQANFQATLNLASHFMKYNLMSALPIHSTNSAASEERKRATARQGGARERQGVWKRVGDREKRALAASVALKSFRAQTSSKLSIFE